MLTREKYCTRLLVTISEFKMAIYILYKAPISCQVLTFKSKLCNSQRLACVNQKKKTLFVTYVLHILYYSGICFFPAYFTLLER